MLGSWNHAEVVTHHIPLSHFRHGNSKGSVCGADVPCYVVFDTTNQSKHFCPYTNIILVIQLQSLEFAVQIVIASEAYNIEHDSIVLVIFANKQKSCRC